MDYAGLTISSIIFMVASLVRYRKIDAYGYFYAVALLVLARNPSAVLAFEAVEMPADLILDIVMVYDATFINNCSSIILA